MASPIFTVGCGGLPWQTPTSCLSDPKNRQTNPIYGILVIYVGGSPPALSTQNHQNNYGQALHRVCSPLQFLGRGWGGVKTLFQKINRMLLWLARHPHNRSIAPCPNKIIPIGVCPCHSIGIRCNRLKFATAQPIQPNFFAGILFDEGGGL